MVNAYFNDGSAVEFKGVHNLTMKKSTFINCASASSSFRPNAVVMVKGYPADVRDLKRSPKTLVHLSNVSFFSNTVNTMKEGGIVRLSNCNAFLHDW